MSLFRYLTALAFADDAIYFAEENGPVQSIPAYALVSSDDRIALVGADAAEAGPGVPENLRRVRLVERGVTVHPLLTGEILRRIFEKFSRPFYKQCTLVAAAPSTDPARAALQRVSASVATEVFMLDQSMGTALGLGLDVQHSSPQVVLSIHEDWCDFAVIELSAVSTQFYLPIGLAEILADIRIHFKQAHQVLLEPAELRAQFLQSGLAPAASAELAGWEAWLGRTELGRMTKGVVSPEVFAIGAQPTLLRIAQAIQDHLATLPAGQRFKLTSTPLHVCGSGARPPGVAEALQQLLGWQVRAHRAEEHPVLSGILKAFPMTEFLQKVTVHRQFK